MGDNNASGQIVVKVTLSSAEALANLKLFVNQADATMKVIKKGASDGTEGMGGFLAMIGQNRMAMMEFGHVARASFDGLVSGMNPARLAMMEMPRLFQAMSMAGSKISIAGVLTEVAQFVPLLGAAFLGYEALRAEMEKGLPMEAFLKKQNDQIKEQVKLIQDLKTLKEGGVITEDQFLRFAMNPMSFGNLGQMMEKGLMVPGKGGMEVSETAKAQAEMNKALADMNESTDEGGKKIQDLQEKYSVLKDRIQAAAIVLLNNNKISLGQYDDLIKNVDNTADAEVDRLVRNLNFENQQKNQHAAEEAYQKGQVYFAQIQERQKAELEAKLTSETANWVGSRLELADHEYSERMTLAMQMLYAGEMSEKQYTDYVQLAANERDKMRAEENRKTLERLAEQRKAELREIQRSIEQDWTKTDAQKYDSLNAGGFTDKRTRGPDPSSFQDQFLSQMVQMQNQWGTMAQQMGKIFSSNLVTAINATSQAFTKLIMGTMTWKQALQSIEASILNELINAIIKMFEQWIIGLILQYTVGKALAAAGLAADAGIAAGESAIWATPATLATIASYGGAAYSAPGIISAATLETMASVAGRETGGPVTAGTPYIVGERRPELFVPNQSGTILPYVPSSITRSSQDSRMQDSSGNVELHLHSWPDENAANKHARDNPTFHHIMMNKVKRSNAGYRPK